MDNELGTRIRVLRKERGLSQEALAQALEVSRQAVTKWEDGSSLPSTANLFALSGFFSIPLAELTGTPEGAASPSSASAMSEKAHVKRPKALRISGFCWLSAYQHSFGARCSILLPSHSFQRNRFRPTRLSVTLIPQRTSIPSANCPLICFGARCCSLPWGLVCCSRRKSRSGKEQTHDR